MIPNNLYAINTDKFDFNKKIKTESVRGAQFSVIYAQGGGWKTTISSYANRPIMLPVGHETGHRVAECAKFPSFSDYENGCPIEHVFAAINWLLKEKHSRKTLIIDNLGSYRESVDKDVANTYPNEKNAFKIAPLAFQYWRYLLEAISVLMNKREMDVILLAHTGLYKKNNTDGTWVDLISINAPQGTNTNARELIEARANNVFYVRDEPILLDDTRGMMPVAGKKRVVSAGKKKIYTRPKEDFFAKTRLPLEESYILERSDNLHDLLSLKNNESILTFWRDFYEDENYMPEIIKTKARE